MEIYLKTQRNKRNSFVPGINNVFSFLLLAVFHNLGTECYFLGTSLTVKKAFTEIEKQRICRSIMTSQF